MALRGVRACLGYTKAEVDRKAASFKTGILVASCGFKVSAAEMYVREQLTCVCVRVGLCMCQSQLLFP